MARSRIGTREEVTGLLYFANMNSHSLEATVVFPQQINCVGPTQLTVEGPQINRDIADRMKITSQEAPGQSSTESPNHYP